jgi:hypothetical protein
MRLISLGTGLCLFGIRLTHHCSPHASHPFDSFSQWLILLAACDCYYLSFRIAIWNRNIVVSFIAVGAWLASVALNIRGTSRTPTDHLFSLSSHISGLCSRRLETGENIYKCSRSTNRCSREFTQDRHDGQPHHERLHSPTYSRWPRQRHWCSHRRCSASPDHAGWAFATPPQEFNWYVEVSLPTGDPRSVFFGLCGMLTSY